MKSSRSNLAGVLRYAAEICSCLLIVLSLTDLPSGANAAKLPKQIRCGGLDAAMQDLDAGRIYEALANLKQVIHRQPDCADAYFYVGTVYVGMHQYKMSTRYAREQLLQWDDAIRAFNSALRIRPDDVQVQVALAKAYVQSNRLGDAIRQ